MNADKKKISFMKTMPRVFIIQFRATPLLTILSLFIGVCHSLLLAVIVVATQNLFDAVTVQGSFMTAVIPLLILAAITFGQQIFNGVHNFFYGFIEGKAKGKIGLLLQSKLQRVDPAHFEDTSFLDDLNKAREGVSALIFTSLLSQTILSFYFVYFVTIGAYLYSLKPILLITLLIAFLPAMAAQIVKGQVFTKLENQSAPLRREYEYYQKTLCDREYFKETRILGAFRYFHRLFSETMELLTLKTWRAERKTALLQILLNLTTFAGMAIASFMLFEATMSGEITIGAFAAVFSALGTIFYVMQEVITHHLGNINKNIGKVVNLIQMLDMPELSGEKADPDYTKGIEAKNISFTYPGRDTPAVKNLSLSIAGNETIAIVGENGAGKSTLVRLLTGIYRPSEGTVTIGGLDTSKTAPASLSSGLSGVFQKYQRYKMTLSENISISDTALPADFSRMETALRDADLPIENEAFTGGLDTMLSPEFDGVDLSGGQWQRLSIARGLYRLSRMIVLDEPTAAIDPIEESKIFNQFQRLAKGKCAVIVTHRLGSAKLANRIIVMDDGKIIDSGTHDELTARPGKYADMWKAQAQWYAREDEIRYIRYGAPPHTPQGA